MEMGKICLWFYVSIRGLLVFFTKSISVELDHICTLVETPSLQPQLNVKSASNTYFYVQSANAWIEFCQTNLQVCSATFRSHLCNSTDLGLPSGVTRWLVRCWMLHSEQTLNVNDNSADYSTYILCTRHATFTQFIEVFKMAGSDYHREVN